MRISSKARYSLFLMAELAYQYNKQLVQIKPFGLKQGLSPKYLEQIVISLKEAGIIVSSRGPRGGYALAKEPQNITLYEILTAAQGPLTPARCGKSEYSVCQSTEKCLTMSLWSLLDGAINGVLSSTTLSDFLVQVPSFWTTHCTHTH